jgi:biotin carboxyl carrier protein
VAATSAGPSVAIAPLQGTVVSIPVSVGDIVAVGQTVAVLESMKMEHVVVAPCDGTVREVVLSVGDTVEQGDRLVVVEPGEIDRSKSAPVVAAGSGFGPS